MRLIFALGYIAFGIWVYFWLGGEKLHPYIGIAFGFALLFSSVIVCNEGFFRKLRGVSDKEHIENLISNKQAVIEEYEAYKSIVFEDLRTGCTAYLIDVGNSNMICLYGQDYGFEPIDDDPEFNQKRVFPTETFSLIRELKKQRVLEVTPKGNVVEPTIIETPNIEKLYDVGFKLEDGEIVKNITYVEVLNAFTK